MSASYALSLTRSFTLTNAREVTSKIAGDLQILNTHYGRPSNSDISDYAEEAAILLANKCLEYVEYGFKRNGVVVFALRYEGRNDGTLVANERPGKLPPPTDMNDCTFFTYLTKNMNYSSLTQSEKESIIKSLPVQRVNGSAPILSIQGSWDSVRTYSSNGDGVERKVFSVRN